MIASSPTDIQPVLDAVAASAARLCDANDAQILLVSGDSVQRVAAFGELPAVQNTPLNRGWPGSRAIIDRETIHIHDIATQLETEFPEVKEFQARWGHRTVLATPLLREGVASGAILIRRKEIRPFSDKQIALLKTFAAQAVIAIENVRLFQELQKTITQLDIANRHKSDFLARVSHDLRTPLNSIIGFTRIVLRRMEGKLPDLQKDNLQKVLISGEHLLGLINTLLDLAKIESGRMEVVAESFRVDDAIHMAATTVEPLLKDGRVRLVRDIAPGLPLIKTDRDKLKQILLNLLSNAAKFTEQGEIRISAAQENGNLKLAVADTGIGMNPEVRRVPVDRSTMRHVGVATETEEADQVVGFGAALALTGEGAGKQQCRRQEPGASARFQGYLDRLANGELREQTRSLEGAAEAVARSAGRAHRRNVLAVQRRRARRGHKPPERVHQRRLPGAVGADESDDLVAPHLQGHAVDRHHTAESHPDVADRRARGRPPRGRVAPSGRGRAGSRPCARSRVPVVAMPPTPGARRVRDVRDLHEATREVEEQDQQPEARREQGHQVVVGEERREADDPQRAEHRTHGRPDAADDHQGDQGERVGDQEVALGVRHGLDGAREQGAAEPGQEPGDRERT